MKKIILLSILCLAACSGQSNQANERENKDGSQLMTYTKSEKEMKQETENYLESTDQNPNFPNTTPMRSQSMNNNKKFEEIIHATTPYEVGNVVVNGRDAWVTIHTGQEMSAAEQKETAKEVTHLLSKGLPRLHFHVNVKP
ncbi:hypothetical protein [Metabacillus iocasae]|uniref:BON domain-containing protein n=1 Tax=Priestia iocasae TaxID=2291674 RepID=A0ABS2QXC5_9BACI|nr:hypothetical protein [Metabacillus iocasae]MBM7704072.1 hypothetical protein [Metabacillus iocasae]